MRDMRRASSSAVATLLAVDPAASAPLYRQLYDRVRRQSHVLQRALLPDELPEASWFELAGRYRPGTVGDEVGGLYWLMTVVLPGYVYFRYPAKLLVIAALGLSMLAARGWDDALSRLKMHIEG